MNDTEHNFIKLQHIYDSIEEIESFKVLDENDLASDSMKRWATIKLIEVIGEAVNHLPDDVKHLKPEIEWKKIVGLRHILVHEYWGVDNAILMKIIQNDIPNLKNSILQLKDKLRNK